jgi:hypothetical protein
MEKTFPVPLKIFYLAAPYRGKTINETRENIRYAESVAAKLWAQGYYVFCPHMNTAFFDGIADDQVFLDAGIEFLNRCDALVLAGNWMDSVGCCAELRAAEERHMPVYLWDDDEEKLVPFRIPREVEDE